MAEVAASRGTEGVGTGAVPTVADPDLPRRGDPERWDRATLDASGDGYSVLRAVRDGDAIVDWMMLDANARVRERWSPIVGDVVGTLSSQLDAAADNSRIFDVYLAALETGATQVREFELELPAGKGGWRRLVVTPVDHETITVVTRDISRERYLESALEHQRRRLPVQARLWTDRATDAAAEARFASRTAAVLFLGCAFVSFANGLLSSLHGVNVAALRLTSLSAALLALVVLVLPWERHFRLVAGGVVAAAVALIAVSDLFHHYSRTPASVAVYPVFFILVVAWTGLTLCPGAATIVACLSAPALYSMLAAGGRSSVGLQCLLVTLPTAALLGEVLSWSSHRARTLTNVEMQRRLHDPLTGLANRTMLSIQLDSALARVRRGSGSLALLYVDLDHFKHINDTQGHAAGDDALIETARRLQSAAREGDTVSRVGGDEFVVLCEGLQTVADATEIAQRLLDLADTTAANDLDHQKLALSIGIAFSATGDETADALLQNADLALYRAKQDGRARYEVFGDSLRDQLAVRRDVEDALRKGIPGGELRVYYQPIVEAGTGAIESFEALARWQRPGYGLVPPDVFIPVAEDAGLIDELGSRILRRACDDAAIWATRWPDRRFGVSVNVSGRQLLDGKIVDVVRHALTTSGLDPDLLTLELTESTLIDKFASAEASLVALRELGVSLAIDDFGTGYSSLTNLRRFPVNTIKIDKSFVQAIGTGDEETAIVSAVINLGKDLELKVVAEGVETPEQLAALTQLDCEWVQGYLFSKPKPADELVQLVERRGTSNVAPGEPLNYGSAWSPLT